MLTALRLPIRYTVNRPTRFVSVELSVAMSGVNWATDASEQLSYFPIRLASDLRRIIDWIFPENTAVLMRALLLGDTTGIAKDPMLSSSLQTTGTSHIVAVSGMNIAFLMGFLSLFINKKRMLTAVGIPVILLFMAVVGFMPPVVRAGIMQIFLLIAPVFKRENDPVTSLSASLMPHPLFNPYAAVSRSATVVCRYSRYSIIF